MYLLLGFAFLLLSFASVEMRGPVIDDRAVRHALFVLHASRAGSAALAGAALAVAGVCIQGLFRNPLADASIIGTTAGASLGGNVAMLAVESTLGARWLRDVAPDVTLPLGCIAGAVLSLALLLIFARRSADVLSLVLAGFLFSSFFLSLGSLVTSLAQSRWELGRAVVAFTLGGVDTDGPRQVLIALPLVAAGVVACWRWSGALDVLLSGDEEAASLGVDVGPMRRFGILWVATLVAGAVSLGGNLPFVGLLVPHALRPFLGASHRRLVPACAVAGAAFVVGCDLLTRLLPARGEIPLGVITGLLGAPTFLWLLVQGRRVAAYD